MQGRASFQNVRSPGCVIRARIDCPGIQGFPALRPFERMQMRDECSKVTDIPLQLVDLAMRGSVEDFSPCDLAMDMEVCAPGAYISLHGAAILFSLDAVVASRHRQIAFQLYGFWRSRRSVARTLQIYIDE